ncbi:TPA: type 1 fimbrial protein [Stenotrophomonas maltophilia]|nr:type 1 fimbrial protein [Stenotrophomonas maltophilia]
MNKLAIALSAALSLGAAASANAADATINFNGKITALTCTIGAGTATGTSVALPELTTSSINSGAANRQTAFNLVMGTTAEPCAAGTVKLQFKNSDTTTDGMLANTAGTTPAGGVALAILNGSTAIDLTKDTLDHTFDATNNTKTWPLTASYEQEVAGTDVTAGNFSADLVVDVTF